MLVKKLVNLARVDVLAAAYDHVGLAVDYVVEAFRVAVADVARVEPAAAEGARRSLLVLEVALENILAAHDYLARLAVGQFVVVLVDDAHLVTYWHSAREIGRAHV